MQRICGLVLAALGVLVAAQGAAGHGQTHSTGYVSSFSVLKPSVLGVLVNVYGPDDFLRISNYSGKTLVVLGYAREPYLRFTRSAVYENVASPTAFLNASRTVPQSAVATTKPRWKQVSRSSSYAWHDHRIVWTGKDPPQVVQDAPNEPHLIFHWRVPARADGAPFRITGFLGWAPGPKTDTGRDWALPAAAAGAAVAAFLAAAAVLGLRARRARRRAL